VHETCRDGSEGPCLGEVVTPCGVEALHRVSLDKDIRDLSERNCDTPKVTPTLVRWIAHIERLNYKGTHEC
jgi:hypothetical protein